MERTANCFAKLDRMNKTLRHEEPDRVPVSDFFWGSFIERWKKDLGLPSDSDIYRYYDLDWIVTVPNMDPHIKDFEILEENDVQVIVRTGFESVIRKKFEDPMPAYMDFETDTVDKMKAFTFDDPRDPRRYFSGGDNQIGGVGDSFARDLPPWTDSVKSLYPDFPVYGSVCEGYETLWRIIGSTNALLWIAMYPDEIGKFVERINEFALEITKAQIEAADGLLAGMVIWGDVAYRNDMFFSPDYWRTYFKPGVTAIVDACHEHDLPVIYHGCGDVSRIFDDYIETGIDAYNPLEAKAGHDVVELRRKYGHRLGFCGNMDVLEWAGAEFDDLKGIVLRKLNAAKGGGMIFQSDHSVPSTISGQRYEHVINLVREFGTYPLDLGEHDIKDM
ncbi:uroporphyrinogen decarboxylase family protein [Candidatus Latescibacterota bacterium]